ncbi:DUF1120 domain-containing protein [Erwinia rhapontici]|uniref:hypothetical protein n=1 Tax=Erwinia rhapontici TaxID=55212 RepID=UPI003D36DA4D
MKKIRSPLTLTVMILLALGSNEIFASSQTTIKLQGEIMPGSCDIGMNSPGSIKLNLAAGQGSSHSGRTLLPEKKLGLMIKCQGATSFAFRARDIAPNAGNVQLAGEQQRDIFSLGLTNKGQAIGGYLALIDPEHSRMDGRVIPNVLVSDNEGVSWRTGQFRLTPSGENIYSWGSQITPGSARQVNIDIILKPFIFNLNQADAIKIDGMTTFEIVYL